MTKSGTLIVNYKELLDQHAKELKSKAKDEGLLNSTVDSTNRITEPEDQVESGKTFRKTRWDIEDEYEDDFIDDSELVEVGETRVWEWGYFAWKGPLNDLFNTDKGKV